MSCPGGLSIQLEDVESKISVLLLTCVQTVTVFETIDWSSFGIKLPFPIVILLFTCVLKVVTLTRYAIDINS